MKVLLYTNDDSGAEWAKYFPEDNFLFINDSDVLLAKTDDAQKGDPVLLFMDFDHQTDETIKLDEELVFNDKVTRVVIAEKVDEGPVKGHSESDQAAQKYIAKPLTKEIVDAAIAEFSSESGTEGEIEVDLSPSEEDDFVDFDLGIGGGSDELEVDDGKEKSSSGIDVELNNGASESQTVLSSDVPGAIALEGEEGEQEQVQAQEQEQEAQEEEEEVDFETELQSNVEINADELKDEETVAEEVAEEETEVPSPPEQESSVVVVEGGLPLSNDELLRMQATIHQLREDRDQLLQEVKQVKIENATLQQESLGQRAELDDLKIEASINKKMHNDELEDSKEKVRLADERRTIAEEKAKKLQKEFKYLEGRVHVDVNQIKQNEQELESKLELMAMDNESQIVTRDRKILELKRKIDQLEFNMENASAKEKQSKYDKQVLEDRLNKIMRTLRGSIELLENDVESSDGDLEAKIRKIGA